MRFITVRAINLLPKGQPLQLNLYTDNQKRERRIVLDDTVEEIRNRFGKRSIYPATLLGDLKIPRVRSSEVIMPSLSRKKML